MVDALASGASVRKGVEVRVFSWAPILKARIERYGLFYVGIFPLGYLIFATGLLAKSADKPRSHLLLRTIAPKSRKNEFSPHNVLTTLSTINTIHHVAGIAQLVEQLTCNQ